MRKSLICVFGLAAFLLTSSTMAGVYPHFWGGKHSHTGSWSVSSDIVYMNKCGFTCNRFKSASYIPCSHMEDAIVAIKTNYDLALEYSEYSKNGSNWFLVDVFLRGHTDYYYYWSWVTSSFTDENVYGQDFLRFRFLIPPSQYTYGYTFYCNWADAPI